jgi:hypothetical protein
LPPFDLATLQLVRVPDAAPPYDCETHGALCPAPSGPVPGRADAMGPADAVGPAGGPRRADGAGSPGLSGPATAAGPRQLAQAMTEVLAGVRPARQLAACATDHVLARIRGLAPGFASDRRPRIQRVVTSRPAAGVVEMTVIAGFGPRTRAVAMRLEHIPARRAAPGLPPRPARWLCTALEAG